MENTVYIKQSNKKSRVFFSIMMFIHGLCGVLNSFTLTENRVINFISFGFILLISSALIILCVSLNKNLTVISCIVLIIPTLLYNLQPLLYYTYEEFYSVSSMSGFYIAGLFLSVLSVVLVIAFNKKQISILKIITNTILLLYIGINGYGFLFDEPAAFNDVIVVIYWIGKVSSWIILLGPIWIVSVTYKKISKINYIEFSNQKQVGIGEQRTTTAATNTDSIKAIKEYKKLLDSGIITQEDFDMKKKELLDFRRS